MINKQWANLPWWTVDIDLNILKKEINYTEEL